MAVHDRLGQARGARREQDPQRMHERDFLVVEVLACHRRVVQQFVPVHRVRRELATVDRVQVGQLDHVLDAGEPRQDLLDFAAAVKRLAAVLVAVDVQEHGGLQLREAVEHARGAEVRPAGGPDRTDGGGRQHRDQCLGHVDDVGADAVAALHAQLAQLGGQDADLAAQFFPADGREALAFVQVQDGRGTGALMAQHVAGVVELGTREPLGTRHRALAQHRSGRLAGLDAEVVPAGLPEAVEVGGRPAPQRHVVREFLAAGLFEPASIVRQTRARDALRRGRPEQLTLLNHQQIP